MRIAIHDLAFATLAVTAALAACNGSEPPRTQGAPMLIRREPAPLGTTVPPRPTGPRRRGWLSPDARIPGRNLIYVSVEYASEVLIYPEKGDLRSPIGSITQGISAPWGLYVDKYGTLYVANSGNNTVTAYPAGSTTPGLTYSKGLSRPLYPIVDRYGNLFVGNANNGTVVEYEGANQNTYTVLQSAGSEVDGMDFDGQGNLYVAYRGATYPNASVEEFAPRSKKGTVLGMALGFPQGLIVDDRGNILVVESTSNLVDLFPPGAQKPSIEVPVPDTPNQLAIDQAESKLLVAAEEGIVYQGRYPFGKHAHVYVKDEPGAIIQGVALSNGQTF
jgi:hypothetical protein